jgi:hypothetical protein
MKGLLVTLFLFVFVISSVSALTIEVHVPEKYNEVIAGERMYFEMAVKYPENPTRVDLRFVYQILDANDNVIAESKTLKAIETQASFIDYIILPDIMDFGMHKIEIQLSDYGDVAETAGASFHVTKNRLDALFTIVYALIGAVVFLLLLIVIVLLRRR